MNSKNRYAQPGCLRAQIESIWAEQIKGWDQLRKGYLSLKESTVREFDLSGSLIRAESISAREHSSKSTTDLEKIAKRRCCLCIENLPEDQFGIIYREEWIFLSNPSPIFDPHFVLNSMTHRPQLAGPAIGVMIDVAEDLEGKYIVTYNGPVAGASIPEHLHTQVVPAGIMPFEKELSEELKRIDCGQDVWLEGIMDSGSAFIGLADVVHRSAVIVVSPERDLFEDGVLKVVDGLNCVIPDEPEPKFNLFVMFFRGRWIAWLFPRTKRRPSFYGFGPEDFLISPGTIDVAGLLMAPRISDLNRLDLKIVKQIYREVTFSEKQREQLREVLLRRRDT